MDEVKTKAAVIFFDITLLNKSTHPEPAPPGGGSEQSAPLRDPPRWVRSHPKQEESVPHPQYHGHNWGGEKDKQYQEERHLQET